MYRDPQNNSVAYLKVGQNFCIEIESNPSTGFSWHLSELDKSIVSLIKQDFKSKNDGMMVGVPGLDLWCFQALAPGQARVELAYYQSWVGPAKTAKTYTLDLRVVPGQ